MTDNIFPGPMSMIKIDGAKIKKLREQQGLTQLYLATAVQVTTDTISRWENRRYPSIKQENGIKLAEALSVQLEELFEDEESVEPDTSQPAADNKEPVVGNPGIVSLSSPKRIWPVLILSMTLLAVLGIFCYLYFSSTSHSTFSTRRLVPPNCTENQAFPVLIRVEATSDKAIALIIKENIPSGAKILSTTPAIRGGNINSSKIKWLSKIKGQGIFAYLISLSGDNGDIITFEGTAAVSKNSGTTIEGGNKIQLGQYHWADSNSDNVINDNEILTVYDRYSEIADALGLDIDLIEEIWLGSGYAFDQKTSMYKVLD